MVTEEKNDKTRVQKPIYIKIKISPKIVREQSYIYDTDKAKYFQNLQNFYNYNVFGYGLNGTQTKFDPTTSEGQNKIQSTFNNSRDRAVDFLIDAFAPQIQVSTIKAASSLYNNLIQGVFKHPSVNGAYGAMSKYVINPIGEGAEAIVINNTPTTVAKITSIPIKEMKARNRVPNTVKSKYIGYVKNNKEKLPTYIQNKVKVITKDVFPKYIGKLDKAMQKSGFKRVNDPQVQYRAYTDGKIVIDDIAPDNIGLTSGNPWLDKILPDFLKKPQIIDMSYQTVPEWIDLGYQLKRNGGKLWK